MKKIETMREKFDNAKKVDNAIRNKNHSKTVRLNKLTLEKRKKLICYNQAQIIDKHCFKSSLTILDIAKLIVADSVNFKRSFKENQRDMIAVRNAVRRHEDDTLEKIDKRAVIMIAQTEF